jgi:hypothetical protein
MILVLDFHRPRLKLYLRQARGIRNAFKLREMLTDASGALVKEANIEISALKTV